MLKVEEAVMRGQIQPTLCVLGSEPACKDRPPAEIERTIEASEMAAEPLKATGQIQHRG